MSRNPMSPTPPSAHRTSGPVAGASVSSVLEDALAITARDDAHHLPLLSREVRLTRPAGRVRSAELLATAHGLYEVRIGGLPATDSGPNPGWTTAARRLQVQRVEAASRRGAAGR